MNQPDRITRTEKLVIISTAFIILQIGAVSILFIMMISKVIEEACTK